MANEKPIGPRLAKSVRTYSAAGNPLASPSQTSTRPGWVGVKSGTNPAAGVDVPYTLYPNVAHEFFDVGAVVDGAMEAVSEAAARLTDTECGCKLEEWHDH